MRALLNLLLWLALSACFAPPARADAPAEDSSQRAQRLLELSRKQNLEKHSLAVTTAREALALFESVNDLDGTATACAHLGQFYLAQNALADSAHYYNRALDIWRARSNVRAQAEVLINLGYVEGRKGEWLNGVSYLTQAHNLINEQSDPALMGKIASGMGYFFNDSGLPESGKAQYQRALEYFRQAGEARSINRMLLLIGYSDFLLKDYDAASTSLEMALDNFKKSSQLEKANLDIAECHEYLGRVYIAMGQYGRALRHLQPILPVYKKSFNPKEAAHVIALIGQIYEQQGDPARARKQYQEASRIFREVSDPVNDASVRFALGRLELKAGNLDAAETYLKDSIENTENLRRDLSTRVFAAAFSASVHERYEAYIECLMRKRKSNQGAGLEVSAFEASELARARSLAQLLRDTQTTVAVGVDPRLAQQERSLRQAIRSSVDQTVSLLATNYKKEELDQLESSLTRLREQHQQITARLRQSNPEYDKIAEPATLSLQQIQTLVIEDDQTVLLEYFLGQNASYVWAITRRGIDVYELPAAAAITSAVRKVYENVSQKPETELDKQLDQATAELAEMVLSPVASYLKARRVVVVADGPLNYIPFQLLPDPNAPEEPLVARHEIVNAPSASILGQLRQEKKHRQPHTKVLAAFGDPVFASNYAYYKTTANAGELTASLTTRENESLRRAWRDVEVSADAFDPSALQPLSYTKFELRNLEAIAGSGAFVARGFAASRQALGSQDLSRYAILHFATHGVLHPEKPEYSGFYLSTLDVDGRPQDGFINLQDVYRLDAPVDLVVLSACRTGLGKDVRGEGLIGLTRGFMFAGASSVVSSLWKVDDEATAELMKHFYANLLQKGLPPAEALRAAQNTLRQDPHLKSPRFWAGFILQGEFKYPISLPAQHGASPLVQKTVGAVLLAMLLAGIGWGYRRRRVLPKKS